MAHPHPSDREKFRRISFCTLRQVALSNPFWTYCDNFGYGKKPELRNVDEPLIGSITSSGLYEGYVRIPWHDAVEPHVSVPAVCSICQRQTDVGITIFHAGHTLGFCTNQHYVRWWLTQHADAAFNAENYESPEERFKEPEGPR